MNTYTLDKVFKRVLTLSLILGLLYLMKELATVLLPFFVASLLAYLLNPLVEKINTKVKRRGLSVAITLIGCITVLAICFGTLIPYLVSEFQTMFKLLISFVHSPQNIERLNQLIESPLWQQLIQELREFTQSEWKVWIQEGNNWTWIQKGLQKLLPGAFGVLSGVGMLLSGIFALFIISLYLVFMLGDYTQFKEEGVQFIPENWRESVLGFISEFDLAMNQYFRAQAMIALLIGVAFALGFSLIGLPMAIFLGLFIGVLNMVPYMQIIGIIPAAFLGLIHTLETGGSIGWVFMWIALLFIVIQIIQDAFLVPKFMGEITGLSPALILLSISIWGQLLGFLGLIIAIPMTCVVLAYYKRYQKILVISSDTRNSA